MSTNPQKIVKQERFQCSQLLIINHRNSLFSRVSTVRRWAHEGYVLTEIAPFEKKRISKHVKSGLAVGLGRGVVKQCLPRST